MSIDWQQRFRPQDKVHARRFDGQTVVLSLVQGQYFSLNETGTVAWEQLQAGSSLAEIIDSVTRQFDIDHETASADLLRLVEELVAAGLLTQLP